MLELVDRISNQTRIPVDQIDSSGSNLTLSESDVVNLVFGASGYIYYSYQDIIISPNEGSFVNIKINLKECIKELTTDKSLKISQKPCEPYPSFSLNLNDHSIHEKKYFYQGLIQVSGGACTIKQVKQTTVDH